MDDTDVISIGAGPVAVLGSDGHLFDADAIDIKSIE